MESVALIGLGHRYGAESKDVHFFKSADTQLSIAQRGEQPIKVQMTTVIQMDV